MMCAESFGWSGSEFSNFPIYSLVLRTEIAKRVSSIRYWECLSLAGHPITRWYDMTLFGQLPVIPTIEWE